MPNKAATATVGHIQRGDGQRLKIITTRCNERQKTPTFSGTARQSVCLRTIAPTDHHGLSNHQNPLSNHSIKRHQMGNLEVPRKGSLQGGSSAPAGDPRVGRHKGHTPVTIPPEVTLKMLAASPSDHLSGASR